MSCVGRRAEAWKAGKVQELGTHILNGLSYSVLLFLLAMPLSLILGMMDFLNIAHGSFFVLGGYAGLSFLGLSVFTDLAGGFWIALILSVVAMVVFGFVIEFVLVRPLYGREHGDQILMTFGLALIIQNLAEEVWGVEIYSPDPPPILSGAVEVAGIIVPSYRLALIVLGVVIALVLWLVLERTRIGSMIRASAVDPDMAALLGVNVKAVLGGVFILGAGLAAFAGYLSTPILGVYPGLDFEIMILALIVVVVGGLGSFTGALGASLLIGITQMLGQGYLPNLDVFVIYIVMIAVLLLRPEGLFQRRYG